MGMKNASTGNKREREMLHIPAKIFDKGKEITYSTRSPIYKSCRKMKKNRDLFDDLQRFPIENDILTDLF